MWANRLVSITFLADGNKFGVRMLASLELFTMDNYQLEFLIS